VVALLSAPSAWAEDEVAELSAAALEAHAQVEQEYVSLLRERRAGITAGSTTPGNDQVPEYFSIRQETKCSAQKYDYFVYAGLSDGVNWEDANSFCTNPIGFNGHLASIECEEENIFANQLAKLYGGPNQVMWLGGSRRNGNVGKKTFTSMVPDVSWKFADGKPFSSNVGSGGSSNWRNFEPSDKNEKCLLMLNDGQWNDAKCTKVARVMALCKRKHILTTTTTATTTTSITTTTTPTGCEAKGWYARIVGGEKCCYRYYNRVVNKKLVPDFVRQTWAGARDQCRLNTNFKHLGDKVHLATIETKAENTFVKNVIYTKNKEFLNRPVWLGGRRQSISAAFTWVDDSEWQYENWREGEPSMEVNLRDEGELFEGCLQMTQPRSLYANEMLANNGELSGDWNDAKCSKKRGYVCEFCHDASIVNP